MDLILTIIADPDGTNMVNHTKVFSQNNGSIGRSEKNDWVLPDPGRIVSSQHAQITFRENHYWLTDTSTNGLYLNDSTNSLGSATPHKLVDGDIFSMGDYKVRVSIRPPKVNPDAIPEGLGAVDFLDESDKTQFSAGMGEQISAQKIASQFDNLLDGAHSANSETNPEDWGYVASASDDLLAAQPTPVDPVSLLSPTPSAPASDWDDDWWKEGSMADNAPAATHALQVPNSSTPIHAQATAPIRPATPVQQPTHHETYSEPPFPLSQEDPFAASRQLLNGVTQQEDTANQPANYMTATPLHTSQATNTPATVPAPGAPTNNASVAVSLAKGLGISDLPASAQTQIPSQCVGIIKETVNRLMDLLRARNSMKNELRVQRTMIQTTNNNPLKFSATAEDALHTMFGHTNRAFLSPENAVKDSFDDLSDHQVAVLAGTRAAYKAMLKHFSPERLEARFSQSGSLLTSKNAKNWNAYKEHYQALMRDAESTYDDLFGEEFAAAYEKQLTDLKNARALSKRTQQS